MSLTKPILDSVVAWDVANGQTFTFNVIGGDLVVGNILYILDNTTNEVVYTLNTTSFKYEAVVPPRVNRLVNGTYYSAYIVTVGQNGNISAQSNIIQFYCYSTPSWLITNISSGMTITNSSVTALGFYNQAEGEFLNDYNFILYDAQKNILTSSGIQYIIVSGSTQNFNYNFIGLESGYAYFIQLVGHTVQGTILDTGLIDFTVLYEVPEVYSVLELTANCDEGYIVYSSKATGIVGYSFPSPPIYTDNGVDLTQTDSYVLWNNGFEISDNFTLKAWVKNPNLNEKLIVLQNNKNDNIVISYVEDPEDINKVLITVLVSDNYFIYSDSIPAPTEFNTLCVQVRRISNIYHVLLEVVE